MKKKEMEFNKSMGKLALKYIKQNPKQNSKQEGESSTDPSNIAKYGERQKLLKNAKKLQSFRSFKSKGNKIKDLSELQKDLSELNLSSNEISKELINAQKDKIAKKKINLASRSRIIKLIPRFTSRSNTGSESLEKKWPKLMELKN